jgi:hypothetical protein
MNFSESNEDSSSQEDESYRNRDDLKDFLKCKTSSFTQTYSEVKEFLDFAKHPLNKFTVDDVKKMIKAER